MKEPVRLPRLRVLELKSVDIDPGCLMKMVWANAHCLKELYLSEVYMKVVSIANDPTECLWIGIPELSLHAKSLWIAYELRTMPDLKLDVLRVTGLGYDDFEPDPGHAYPNYDLDDPLGLERSFDQRFVEAVLAKNVMGDTAVPDHALKLPPLQIQAPHSGTPLPPFSGVIIPPPPPSEMDDYDADTYQRGRNPTSNMIRCIDGHFFNRNAQHLKALQRIISVSDRGMALIDEELARSQRLRVNAIEGTLEPPGDLTNNVPEDTN